MTISVLAGTNFAEMPDLYNFSPAARGVFDFSIIPIAVLYALGLTLLLVFAVMRNNAIRNYFLGAARAVLLLALAGVFVMFVASSFVAVLTSSSAQNLRAEAMQNSLETNYALPVNNLKETKRQPGNQQYSFSSTLKGDKVKCTTFPDGEGQYQVICGDKVQPLKY